MRDQWSFKFNNGEPRDADTNCVSVLTWEDHAYFVARLENGWWRVAHFHPGEPVEWLRPTKSGKVAYHMAVDHKNAVQAQMLRGA